MSTLTSHYNLILSMSDLIISLSLDYNHVLYPHILISISSQLLTSLSHLNFSPLYLISTSHFSISSQLLTSLSHLNFSPLYLISTSHFSISSQLLISTSHFSISPRTSNSLWRHFSLSPSRIHTPTLICYY